jgi:hypothetical protein
VASITNLVNELAIYRFAPWTMSVSSGLDLTGCTASATLRDNYESFAGTAIEVAFVNRTSGEIRLSLSALDTSTLSPKTYVWDLLITTALGDVIRLRYGRAIVRAGISGNNSIAQAIAIGIAQHNADLMAHPDLRPGGGARQTFSNANATIAPGSKTVAQTGVLTAARTLSLPLASAVTAGAQITIADESGSVTSVNKIVISAAGTNTANGGAAVDAITAPYGFAIAVSNGLSKWTIAPLSSLAQSPTPGASRLLALAQGGRLQLAQGGFLQLAGV